MYVVQSIMVVGFIYLFIENQEITYRSLPFNDFHDPRSRVLVRFGGVFILRTESKNMEVRHLLVWRNEFGALLVQCCEADCYSHAIQCSVVFFGI